MVETPKNRKLEKAKRRYVENERNIEYTNEAKESNKGFRTGSPIKHGRAKEMNEERRSGLCFMRCEVSAFNHKTRAPRGFKAQRRHCIFRSGTGS